MIASYWDKYNQNGSCFLEDLFMGKKLEYVHLNNIRVDINLMGSIPNTDNIESLRYMYI